MQQKDILKKQIHNLGHFIIDEREETSFVRENPRESQFCVPLYDLRDQSRSPNYSGVKAVLFELCKLYHFQHIQLECKDTEMTRFFLDQIYPYMQTYFCRLILSQENIDFFKTENHPCMLLNYNDPVINEETWIIKKEKTKKGSQVIRLYLSAIAKSDNFSLIERKIHLYLLGMQISRSNKFIPDFFILDYQKISDTFEKIFNVKKKLILKAIDRLIKKRAISVSKNDGDLFFYVAEQGPMDLIAGNKGSADVL